MELPQCKILSENKEINREIEDINPVHYASLTLNPHPPAPTPSTE